MHLLPNVTNLSSSIESRGASLARSLKSLLGRIGEDRCHLVAHSFTGVDARAALSMYEAAPLVQSLTTISSPHHGLKLVDLCE